MWRGRAFGLELSGDFPAPGLEGTGSALAGTGSGRRSERATRLAVVPPAALAPAQGRRLATQPLPGGTFSIELGPDGYRIEHDFYGSYRVAADGTEIGCAPSPPEPWVWQRLVVGQLLPLSAALQGLEPLHASAVADDGRALLVMGPSGAGKSSVALHMAAAGKPLIADDVVALELAAGEAVAHPGAALASIAPGEHERLPARARETWDVLGADDGELRMLVPQPAPDPLPTGAVYVLARRADAAALAIEPVASGHAELLLGGTFNPYLSDAARLERQLTLAARIAESVPLWQVTIPPSADAGAVAAAIAADLR